MKNYYSEFPQLQFEQTKIDMAKVIQIIEDLKFELSIKRAVYVKFRIESANGTKGINNNYFGLQADSGRWPAQYDMYIAGTVTKNENQTNKERIFLAFRYVSDCIAMVSHIVKDRGLYIGGMPHKFHKFPIKDSTDWVVAYMREWVRGDANYYPDLATLSRIKSICEDAEKYITK